MPEYDTAKEIFRRAFPSAVFEPQPATDWQGDVPLPDAVAEYYRELGPSNVTIGSVGNPFFLPKLTRLWKGQAGYRYHGITGERLANWQDGWFVVADMGADPFIYARDSSKVLFALHGQGVWETSELFSGLAQMATCLATLGEIVVTAGEAFSDEESGINPSFRIAAKERLTVILGSETNAEAVLSALEWY
ncbi:MAG: hypothetical protein H7Z41_08925 [Cytophagales bacterium]|nr:hypothetical protein [Armatimonadota bacterium]